MFQLEWNKIKWSCKKTNMLMSSKALWKWNSLLNFGSYAECSVQSQNPTPWVGWANKCLGYRTYLQAALNCFLWYKEEEIKFNNIINLLKKHFTRILKTGELKKVVTQQHILGWYKKLNLQWWSNNLWFSSLRNVALRKYNPQSLQ